MTRVPVTCHYNAANQLIRLGNESITYDANGNRLEDGKYQYEWNEADQLVSITRKGESTPFVTYKYDGMVLLRTTITKATA